MKAFSLLFLVLISFAASLWIGDYDKCMKNGQEGVCCRMSGSACCDYKPGQMCAQVITQCCTEKKLDPNTKKMNIRHFSRHSNVFDYSTI